MSTNPVVTEQPESQITITQHKSIFDKAVCLAISREWPPMTKAIPKEKIQTTGDKKKFHGSKDLYDSVHLKKLGNLEIALDNTIKRYASAPFPLKTGVYILGVTLYTDVEAIIAKHVEQREELINAFVTDYNHEVAKAREFQGDAFDPSDYETPEKIKSYFKFKWNYLTMDVAESLQQIGKDVVERERQKLEAEWQDARVAARQILRAQMAGLVNHLVDRLSPSTDGKRKIFRNSVLDPLNEFIRTFSPRDLTEDSDLKALVDKTQQLVNGVSPQELRDNDTLRTSVQQGFAEVKAVLATMIEEAPDREIELEPEEEVTVQ